MTTPIAEQLIKYLTDAHSIEEQSLAQLRTAPDLAEDAGFAQVLRDHLQETESHEERIRALLEARDASPSRVKDTVMAAGGKGFLLFARSQPDTPGKLLAHSLSYEGLEAASYALLAEVADAAGEPAVAETARAICAEERAMMERLQGCFDAAVARSIADTKSEGNALLSHYLADAHGLEGQSTKLLERAVEQAGSPELEAAYRSHLAETRQHAELIEGCLEAIGESPSFLKDLALKLGGIEWSTFFGAHPDTPGKLLAFAYAYEWLEIGGYEELERVARHVGDAATVEAAAGILVEERAAAKSLSGLFKVGAAASLAAQDVTV